MQHQRDEGPAVARLLKQLETIVEESGTPAGFDARAWLSAWLREPLPALGNERPIALLGTIDGEARVSQKLAQIQSGAYA